MILSTFGWLLHPPTQQEPSKLKPPSLSLFLFFRRSIHRPNQQVNVLTTRSTRSHLLSTSPPHRKHHRSFDCCVNPMSGGHPRPVLRPSLNFSMGAISAPQTRGSNAARASPNAGGLQKTHRESWRCDLGPWRLLPWRERAKPLGVEQKKICELDLLW